MFEETNLTGQFSRDYLDEYCMIVYGHTNWSFVPNTTKGKGTLVFFSEVADEEDETEDNCEE
jgi:hypothetical protein